MKENSSSLGFVPSSRFAPPEKITVSLRSHPGQQETRLRNWEGDAAAFLESVSTERPGSWRVVGSAGSGVTSLVVDAVLARIRAGVDPSRIVVLTASKESGARLRRELSHILPSMGYVSESSLVRSVHSFAFSLVRLAALRKPDGTEALAQGRAPRLMTGAEQDVAIRELLAIHAEDGGTYWPQEVREALPFVGFARQLRDFLLRAQERGVSHEELVELGRRVDRPMWTAAGKFLREYEQVTQLSGAQLYNASELVVAALNELRADPVFLLEQQAHIDTIVIDDAQQLDPQAAELISVFADSASFALAAGNPEHSVFHFRGATSRSLTEFPATHELRLLERKRPLPETDVVCCDSDATELTLIADALRRKNLLESIPWKDMAVIVRSSSAIPPLRRALLAAGVPVQIQPTDVVLSQQRLVSNLLLACRSIERPLTAAELEELILGPVGGADSVTLRRLLRGLRQSELKIGGTRRAIDVFLSLVTASTAPTTVDLEFLTDREIDILSRLRTVLRAGTVSKERGDSVEMILWEIWDATDLSDRLMYASLRGGALGSAADLDLDAVMTLFDAAGDFVERRPTAGIDRFIQYIEEQELPSGARDRRGNSRDAVSLLTAHATVGMEWPVVVVAKVQEGMWPSLGETGSLFGQEELIDYLDNDIDVDTIIARTSERVGEERRLFTLATSRATQDLLVTAVLDSESDQIAEPSRFVSEYAQQCGAAIRIIGADNLPPDSGFDRESLGYVPERSTYPRLLSVPSIVAELRRVVTNDEASPRIQQEAARQLARLAQAGVPGADPAQWWGLEAPSSQTPLRDLSQPQNVSPSKIESAQQCPLRAALGSYGEDDETPLHMVKGLLVHAAAEARARGVDRNTVETLITDAYAQRAPVPRWKEAGDREEFAVMLRRTLNYVESNNFIGVELPVFVEVADLPSGAPIRIKGRMDFLAQNQDGEYVIVDVKTGKNPVAQNTMSEHAQLAAYQLALSRGELSPDGIETAAHGHDGLALGGGLLIYPAKDSKKLCIRDQAAKTTEELDELAAHLPGLVESVTGPTYLARVNEHCNSCPLISSCPAQPEGRSLTHV